MSENRTFVQAFLKKYFLFLMGRAREQTKGATFLKYLSMGRAGKLEKYNRFLKIFSLLIG